MDQSIFRKLELLDTESRKQRLKSQRGSGADANINITPLVDVVLVLLIIFMVVTPMINEGLRLPFAESPDRVNAQGNDLKIILKQSGEMKVGDATVQESNLRQALEQELSGNPNRPVYISADKALPFKKIRELLSVLREAGVPVAGLVSTLAQEES